LSSTSTLRPTGEVDDTMRARILPQLSAVWSLAIVITVVVVIIVIIIIIIIIITTTTTTTLNIRSILHPLHSAALSDIMETHHPDLFCLTETLIKPTITPTELAHCTPNYTSMSLPLSTIIFCGHWRRHWFPRSRTFPRVKAKFHWDQFIVTSANVTRKSPTSYRLVTRKSGVSPACYEEVLLVWSLFPC